MQQRFKHPDMHILRSHPSRLHSLLLRWTALLARYPRHVLVTALILTALGLVPVVRDLTITTDTTDMLDRDLPFRRLHERFKKAFPQMDGLFLVLVEGKDRDRVTDAAIALADRLSRDRDLFQSVYLPSADPFFQGHGLLYLSREELDILADRVSRAQPILARLSRDPGLPALFEILGLGARAKERGEALDLDLLYQEVAGTIEGVLEGSSRHLSWTRLMGGSGTDREAPREIILVKPRKDWDRLLPLEAAIQRVQRIWEETGLSEAQDLRLRMTGELALEHEELLSLRKGAEIATALTMVLVGLCLTWGLGSGRMVFATFLTLVIGLLWTAAFAALTIGRLNLISVAFAILYIGLGVDYSIHYCLRYKEIRQVLGDSPEVLGRTQSEMSLSLLMCTLTTALGFYAFVPTSYAGVAELGIIAGTGMIIAYLLTLTVLPALLLLFPPRPAPARSPDLFAGSGRLSPEGRGAPRPRLSRRVFSAGDRLADLLFTFPVRHAKTVRRIALALGLGSLCLLPFLRFDRNTLNLGDPRSESVLALTDLLGDGGGGLLTLDILTPSLASAEAVSRDLEGLKTVRHCITLENLIPRDQGHKLEKIEELALLFGPGPPSARKPSSPPSRDAMQALKDLRSLLTDCVEKGPLEGNPRAEALLSSLQSLEKALSGAGEEARKALLARVEEALTGGLPGRLRTLWAGLKAREVTEETLPQGLRSYWKGEGGEFRVEVHPAKDLFSDGALQEFVRTVQSVTPEAIGLPVIMVEAGDTVLRAFQTAGILSLLAILLILLLALERKADIPLVLVPLLLSASVTGALCVLMDIPINFANIIALPLILGIGVDNGIHVVQRFRHADPGDPDVLKRSTSRAMVFSALTTLCGFGNLAFCAHRGMASMGLVLFLGILVTLLMTLFVLPALLVRSRETAPADAP